MQWAAFSGYYDDADAAVKTGTSYFSYAGDRTGLALTDFPELGADNRSLTLKYSKPFADWETALGGPGVDIPAHVLAGKAGLRDVPALVELLKHTPRGDVRAPKPANARLRALADVWNNGFDSKTLPADPMLYLSNGPYIVKSLAPDQSLTLVRNKDYNGARNPSWTRSTSATSVPPQPRLDAQNHERRHCGPAGSHGHGGPATALQSQGVTADIGNQLAYDHLDLNYSGPFADKDVRQAFLKAVPRKDIADKIVEETGLESRRRSIPRCSFRTRPDTPIPFGTTGHRLTRTWTSRPPKVS